MRIILLFITCIYLGAACGSLWILFRHSLTCKNSEKGIKILFLYGVGHALAAGAIFMSIPARGFFIMCAVAAFPLLGMYIHRRAKATYYEGNLNLLYTALLLTSLQLLIQFRLGLSIPKLAGLMSLKGGVPISVHLILVGGITIVVVSSLLFTGGFRKAIEWVENRTRYTFWGIVSILTMAVPFIAGTAVGRTHAWAFGKSGQVSEWGLKLFFPIFLSLFLGRHAKEMSSPGYPGKEIAKTLIVFTGLVSLYFLVPLVIFQREQGTALLIGITIAAMVSYATGRWYTFPLGISLIAGAIGGAMIIDPHTRERIIGAWIAWEQYIHKPFLPGVDRYPGWQIAQVHAVMESASVWGLGIGRGRWTKLFGLSSDFIIAPFLAEYGVVGLVLVVGGYLIILMDGISGPPTRDFRGFLRVGIPVTICCQGFFNILAVLGVVPLAGVPLPFMSNGGSALVANWILIGLMAELGRRREIVLVGKEERA